MKLDYDKLNRIYLPSRQVHTVENEESCDSTTFVPLKSSRVLIPFSIDNYMLGDMPVLLQISGRGLRFSICLIASSLAFADLDMPPSCGLARCA